MDLSKYESLTGVTVPDSRVVYMTAQLKRAQTKLEAMLGFTLDPTKVKTNIYKELGKTTIETACPDVDTQSLDPADAVIGAYRLYEYNELDRFFQLDPFKEIHKMKLVFLRQGDAPNGITTVTFDDDHVKQQMTNDGFGKYVERTWNRWQGLRCPYGSYMLAVDADWLWDGTDDQVPDDLLYVAADMTDYYSDPKRFLQQEKITSHEYRQFERTAPELQPENVSIIKRYAGPYGSASPQPTTGARPNWNSQFYLPLGNEGFNAIV